MHFRRYQDIVIIRNAITIFGWGELIKEENTVYLLILSPTRQGILVNAIHLLHEKYLAHLTFGRLKRLYWPQLPHFLQITIPNFRCTITFIMMHALQFRMHILEL